MYFWGVGEGRLYVVIVLKLYFHFYLNSQENSYDETGGLCESKIKRFSDKIHNLLFVIVCIMVLLILYHTPVCSDTTPAVLTCYKLYVATKAYGRKPNTTPSNQRKEIS